MLIFRCRISFSSDKIYLYLPRGVMLTRECWQSRDGVGLWDTLGLSVQTTVSHHTPKQTQDVNQEWHCEGEGFWHNFNYNYNSKFEVKGGCS